MNPLIQQGHADKQGQSDGEEITKPGPAGSLLARNLSPCSTTHSPSLRGSCPGLGVGALMLAKQPDCDVSVFESRSRPLFNSKCDVGMAAKVGGLQVPQESVILPGSIEGGQ
jgi:hypothetical protein